MTNYIQRIFAQNNPTRVLVSRLSAEKLPARFVLSRILRMTKLCRLLHIQRTGYVLKFHPASLAMALWVDPHNNRLDSEAIRALLREGDSYVDVGTNIGHLSIEAAFAVGFEIASVGNGELLPIQRDHTVPKCVNLFSFPDTEELAVRMGLRA